MKDYTLDLEQKKKFILNYKIVGNEIIVKLASGEDYFIPYNEENETKIIDKMKTQIEEAYGVNSPLREKKKQYHKIIKVFGIFLIAPLSGLVFFLLIGGVTIPVILFLVPAFIIVGGFIRSITEFKKLKKKIIDAEKQKFFLANEQTLNENIRKNKNMLLGVSKQAQMKIENSNHYKVHTTNGTEYKPFLGISKRPVFRINNIDDYSYADLKILRDNFERIKNFGFNEEVSYEQGTTEDICNNENSVGPNLKKTNWVPLPNFNQE